MQLSFDELGAQRARDEAIARVEANANADWRYAARDALRACARHLDSFTADDVIAELDARNPRLVTHNLAALGPVFLAAARDGEIRKTGALRPSRITRRHRDLTVWSRA